MWGQVRRMGTFCSKELNSLTVSRCVCIFSRIWLFATPWTVVYQAPLTLGFSRQEYYCGWPFLILGDLPDPGIELESLVSPALAGRFFTIAPPGDDFRERFLKTGWEGGSQGPWSSQLHPSDWWWWGHQEPTPSTFSFQSVWGFVISIQLTSSKWWGY